MKSRSYLICIRALRYASKYLKRIDLSSLSHGSRKDISELIADLDAIIEYEDTDLPF